MSPTPKPRRRRSLVVAIVAASAAGLGAATGFSYLFGAVIYHSWAPWLAAGDATASGVDVLRLAFYATAGLGAIAALVVTYRRQALAEQQADDADQVTFAERFQRATEQLGSPHAAVRMGGVYAVASLADTYPLDTPGHSIRRQQCIDTLCGYLRLPYRPQGDRSLVADLATTTRTHEIPGTAGSSTDGSETRTYTHNVNDREVRLTIITTIRNHLQEPAGSSWQGHDFDFTGATFDGGNFDDVVFSGGNISFAQATFTGTNISFARAMFIGGDVSFAQAMFIGGDVSFAQAMVTGGDVSFVGAVFNSGNANFSKATFSGGHVRFDQAMFSGGNIHFADAAFKGGHVHFGLAIFNSGSANFSGVTFGGGHVHFGMAIFNGGHVSFPGAMFNGGRVSFSRAMFSDGDVQFAEAAFDGGNVTFAGAAFRGGNVDFTSPASWSIPPTVDWAPGDTPPRGVSPSPWPLAHPGHPDQTQDG